MAVNHKKRARQIKRRPERKPKSAVNKLLNRFRRRGPKKPRASRRQYQSYRQDPSCVVGYARAARLLETTQNILAQYVATDHGHILDCVAYRSASLIVFDRAALGAWRLQNPIPRQERIAAPAHRPRSATYAILQGIYEQMHDGHLQQPMTLYAINLAYGLSMEAPELSAAARHLCRAGAIEFDMVPRPTSTGRSEVKAYRPGPRWGEYMRKHKVRRRHHSERLPDPVMA